MEGKKFDQGKLPWNLLPWKEVEGIVSVLHYGAEKYEPENWKLLDHWKERYFAALIRHLLAWWNGERFDQESGIHHLYHAGCNLVFLAWFDNNGKNENG